MPWPFFIPEFLKRRACRYLIHYYLGQFIEEKISLDDLTIDLYNGTGSVSNVPLNIETINEVLEEASAPIQVVSGYIGCISILVPWSSLMTSSCKVELSGLTVTVAPSSSQYGGQVSMTDSLFFSMSKSRHLAEEVLKATPTDDEGGEEEQEMGGFEGMEVLAKAIETILLRVRVSLVDTTISVCRQTTGEHVTNQLSVQIARIDFFDEVTQTCEPGMSGEDGDGKGNDIPLPEIGDFDTKVLRLSGLTVTLDHNTRDQGCGIPIACARGEVDVKVKIKQSDVIEGPKLSVHVSLEAVHMLLYPQQLHTLLELVSSITDDFNKHTKPVDQLTPRSHSHAPGHSRPIPKHDMTTIEKQLIDHIDVERRKKMAEDELLQLDPWDISARKRVNIMTESVGSEMFYSFDLQKHGDDEEEMNSSRSPKGGALDNGRYGEGAGLEGQATPRLHPPHRDSHFTPTTRQGSSAIDVCIYSVTLGGLTCAILENKPVHTHVTRSNGRESEASSETDSYSSARADSYSNSPELCSLDEGGLDPFKYFDCVMDIVSGNVGQREMKNCESKLGQVLPADHIFFWMSTINSRVTTEGPVSDISLTIVSAELLEYLYHNEASLPLITPVSIKSLIQFQQDPSCHEPCLSVQINSQAPFSGSNSSSPFVKSKSSSNDVHSTDVGVALSHLHVYLDVTIIDRLYSLLHPQTTLLKAPQISLSSSTHGNTGLYYPSVNNGIGTQKKFVSQVLFSEAMSSNESSKTHKVSLKMKVKTVDISMRFPVADLSQLVRPPWYRPPLRKEVLFMELLDLSLSSIPLLPLTITRTVSGVTSFRRAKMFFSLDGSHDNKQLFIIIDNNAPAGCDQSRLESLVDMPSIKLTYQLFEDSPLNTDHQVGVASVDSDEEEEFSIGVPSTGPSPFSQRNEKVLFSSDKAMPEDQDSSRQIILPASSKEMAVYQQHLSSTSRYSLSFSIPSITVHIPNKAFLDTLYNRVAMDLLLWKPTSPAIMEKVTAKSVFYSSADILQPAISKEDKFKLCKSVLKEDSVEDSFVFSSIISHTHSAPPTSPSLLMTSLTIDRGLITLVLPIKTEGVPSSAAPPTLGPRAPSPDPRLLDLSPRGSSCPSTTSSMDPSDNGLLWVETTGWNLCNVIDYEGEPERSQLCCKIEEISVKHCGRVPQPLSLLINPNTLHLDATPLKPLMNDVLSTWANSNGRDIHKDAREPVLSLSVDSKTEKETNRRVHQVAIQLSNGLLNYSPTHSHLSFFQQCVDFFQLTEIAVPGYEPPTVITELYFNLDQSGIQYRPIHLPSQAVLMFDALTLTTTLVTDSPLLVFDIFVDEMRLFVSDRQHDCIVLKKDFVCVLEMNVFQLALRLCNKADMTNEASKLFSQIPDVDLQCSGSELHMMFCVDTCTVFRDLILYMARNGDLTTTGKDTTVDNYPVLEPITVQEVAGDDPSIRPRPSNPPVMVSSTIGDLISEAMEDGEEGLTTSTTMSSSGLNSIPVLNSSVDQYAVTPATGTLEYHFQDGHSMTNGGGMTLSNRADNPIAIGGKKLTKQISEEWEIDEDDYCVLTSPTTSKVGPGAEPVVKCLLKEGESFKLVDNYYQVPDVQVDQLKRPKGFPNPNLIYSLRELTIIWHLYGGRDFSVAPPGSASPTPRKHKAPLEEEGVAFHKKGDYHNRWKRRGGVGRDQDVLMEMELNKLRLQYESYPEGEKESSRFVLLIRDIEIRDRLVASRINKFLYHYATETRPRQSHANMFSFKVLLSHPEVESQPASVDSFQCLEASVLVSMLPIRLNIDQDAIFFLYEFFDYLLPSDSDTSPSTRVTSSSDYTRPAMDITDPSPSLSSQTAAERPPLKQAPPTTTPTTRNAVFIKSFVFYPDVPIRIDYEAKRFHSKQLGTLTGMLLGLSHLDNSEVTLKSITYKNGVLGWNQLFERVSAEWMQDIQRYQLPRILQGVGPVYHVTQLFQGALDLFWLPVQQYQEDGRIIWGIQRGANSFVSSSGVAVVELSSRMLQSVEGLAKTAFDMVNVREQRQSSNQLLDVPPTHQPADLREGIVNAYNVVSTGIGDTAWDLYDAASTEHQEYGVTGAVGGVLKNIPGTVVRPIIFMSEATRHVLGGMKNQFVPEARKEANEKWKNN